MSWLEDQGIEAEPDLDARRIADLESKLSLAEKRICELEAEVKELKEKLRLAKNAINRIINNVTRLDIREDMIVVMDDIDRIGKRGSGDTHRFISPVNGDKNFCARCDRYLTDEHHERITGEACAKIAHTDEWPDRLTGTSLSWTRDTPHPRDRDKMWPQEQIQSKEYRCGHRTTSSDDLPKECPICAPSYTEIESAALTEIEKAEGE